ncbi:hypothetical protein [Streptomyces sp. NPDC048111]|uniref:hypothetical protein n=1 Tax=Streptomyces sp. NPDC048111 TaxID=3365500 RepID=UPI00371EAE46
MSDSTPGPQGPPSVTAPSVTAPPAAAPSDEGIAALGVARTPTGDARVDGLVDRLGDLDHLGTDEHLEVYEDVHRGLRDSLTALDTPRPGTSGPVRALADQVGDRRP